ncbi:hypothetical protein B0H34DRAFT_809784 [Crassisporium funariophilum]|nr:hypothetical protein B0H34DRAFT_809784 [Crassisporium funariophilum]
MKVSFSLLLSIVAFIAQSGVVSGTYDYSEFDAREMVNDVHFQARDVIERLHARSEVLNSYSTRELVDELENRLERRMGSKCSKCGKWFPDRASFDAHIPHCHPTPKPKPSPKEL